MLVILLIEISKRQRKYKSVCIVVLGDIGRSPRMQYHALSFLKEGYKVDIIGYHGSAPLQELQNNPRVFFYYINEFSFFKNSLCLPIAYFLKAVCQSLKLLQILITKCNNNILFIQNPPAVPTIPVCYLYCRMLQIKLAIDWHNYSYTLLSSTLGGSNIFVKAVYLVEFYFGSKANYNFCVTTSMKKDLEKNWKMKATVFYDRPKEEFQPISLMCKHTLFSKLSKEFSVLKGKNMDSTIFTQLIETGDVELLPNRPGLIISSTSWTEDENFTVLIEALNDYEQDLVTYKHLNLPDLICIITGKGPLKDFYKAIIKNKMWKHITVITPWLKSEDYPKIIACADLGVSLHSSSSGLDLPMKVIDMFGCGLPVCALNFDCLYELVQHNENSFVFEDKQELANLMKSWFTNFPNNEAQKILLKKFKNKLTIFQKNRWHENWCNIVLPNF